VLIAALLVNGLLMLAAPAVWHQTPWWFRSFSGIPTNRNPNGGSFRIRMYGAALLLLTTVLLYCVLCQPRNTHGYRLVRVAPPASRTT
jgi:hypothetical protein